MSVMDITQGLEIAVVVIDMAKSVFSLGYSVLSIVTSELHCTTRPEIGLQRGFGQWLQLVHCANLLLWVRVFLELSSTSSELNQN